MKKFWELFEQSIIVQSLITLLVVGTYVFLVGTGQQINDQLMALLWVIIGFYFGSKVHVSQQQQIKSAVSQTIKAYALGEMPKDEENA